MISPPEINPDLLHDPGYPPLKDFIIQATGLAYYLDKDEDLGQRIGKRFAESAQHDCGTYLDLLRDTKLGDGELDRLAEELTVGETSFFRHAELFDGLRRKVLPDLIARNLASRRLRIWSAGSSIGAEVYSLAILLAREFADQIEGWEISILGTDINRCFLARANEGVFRSWDFRGVELSQIEDCFARHGEDWIIKPEYRRWVSFQHHNLVRQPFPSLINNLVAFDLVLCRNVLIYFSPEIIRRLIDQFHECILDGGWLLVGHAEPNVDLFRAFHTVNVPGAILYQKPRQEEEDGGVSPAANRAKPPPCSAALPTARPRINPSIQVTPAARTGIELSSIQRLADRGDLDGAVRKCELLIAQTPKNPSSHLYLAMLTAQVGDHRRSEESLRRTIDLAPGHALAHYYLGLLQQKKGEQGEAARSYGNALHVLANQPDDSPIPGADGMTAGDLRDMTRMQQEVLRP